ncbi:MAG: hypothetical protein AB8H79_26965 [Myxococcota bacterium]
MSPRAIGWIIVLLAVLAAVGTSTLFWLQNSARGVMLSLNLGVAKFALAEPVPVPVLMGICVLSGFVLALVLVLALRSGRSRNRSKPADNPYLQPGTAGSEGEQAW